MGKKNRSKYDLTEAKELYMAFLPIADIAKKVGIPYKTLVYHAMKWKEERGLLRNELLRELTELRVKQIDKVTGEEVWVSNLTNAGKHKVRSLIQSVENVNNTKNLLHLLQGRSPNKLE